MSSSGCFVVLVSPLLLITVAAQSRCNTGEVCLAGGRGSYEGRVQVCSSGAWGTVCDDSWSSSDARVVCRQLGYVTTGATAFQNALFGAGTGSIVMDDVACSGTESRLLSCSYTSNHNCGHSEDASVRCSTTQQGQTSTGVCYRSERYTAYRQASRSAYTLRYTRCTFWRCSRRITTTVYVSEAYSATRYIPVCCSSYTGNGHTCTPVCSGGCGNGRCIAPGRCACNSGWTGSRCSTACCFPLCVHGACSSPGRCTCNSGWKGTLCDIPCCNPRCVNGRCTRPNYCSCNSGWAGSTCNAQRCLGREGQARLLGGTSMSGRVEVCVGGVWGTVCDDLWDNTDASVACYQLGFSRHNAVATTSVPAGTGPILMDNVRCSGSETRLSSCLHYTTHDCSHYEDAGVTCRTRLCSDGAVRLVGTSVTKGRVEVCLNEAWGTVCDQNWSVEDARVVCGQLGFLRTGALSYSDALLGQGTGLILMSNVRCTGSESTIRGCSHYSTTGSCTHADDAGVKCRTSRCRNGDLWLVDGLSDNEGRLEICYNYQWGTVCDDRWTQSSTNVACRQLGVRDTTNVIRLTNNIFSTASSGTQILLDDVTCRGSESTLLSCPRRSLRQHDCGHSEDVTLRCGVCTEGAVRLVNGPSHNEGKVEVCLSGVWGTVCDDGWSLYDARVACRQLGYPTTGATALSGSSYTPNFSIPIVMDAVACRSTEQILTDCTYRNVSSIRTCSHAEDARLRCTLSPPGTPRSFRTSTITATSIRMYWSNPSPSDPPSATVTRYSVSCSSPGQSTRSLLTSITSATVSSLRAYTTYSCCVAADSSVGLGSQSCLSRRTSESAPSVPQSVTGVPTSSRSISLTWLPPLTPNGVVREYRVTITQGGSSRTLTSRSQSILATVLHPYYTYSLRVAAVTVAQGPYSSSVYVRTFQDVPGHAPSTPVSSHITTTSFRLTWSAPAAQYINGILTHYRLQLENRRTRRYNYVTIQPPALLYTAYHLTPYTVYECSVTAATVNGTGPYSSELSVTTSEAAPSGPPRSTSYRVLSATSLRLWWYSPSSSYQNGVIRHYSLQLNDTDGLRTVTQTSYTAYNLHPYYIYAYRVAAFTVGIGPYSQWSSVRMPQAAPSGPPTNFHVTEEQLTAITLAWQPPHSTQKNGIITNYTVYITPQGASSYTAVTTALTMTVSSLLSNSNYSFAVAASTVVGRGPYTNPPTVATTLSPATTSAPENVNLLVLDHERIFVTWTPPPVSQQSGAIAGYTVSVRELATGRKRYEDSSQPQLTLINLHPYYNYEVRVKVVPTSGSGRYSHHVIARTQPSEPSGSPTIAYTETTAHSVFLRWRTVPSSQQNGIVSGYIINYVEDGHARSVSVSVNVIQYEVQATPYTEYVLSVAAVNSVGQGPFSAVVEVRTDEDGPTHHPRNLFGRALSSTAIRLSWDPPPDEHHNGVIDSYTVLCTEVNSGGSLSRYTISVTNITINGLHPYYTYNCNVSAVTVEHGPFSAITSTTTLEDAPSGPPTNVIVTDESQDSVSLSWTAPIPALRNGLIRHYLISAFPVISPTSNVSHRTPSTSTHYTLTGLQPYMVYHVSVAAITISPGPTSDSVEARTLEDAPSRSPSAVELSPLSPHSLSVMWQPPPANFQNGVIQFYSIKVVEDETFRQRVVNTSNNVTQYSLNELHPYYHYSIVIAAVTVATGPFSSPRSIRMPQTAPSSPPTHVRAGVLNSTSIHLQWEFPPPEHQNGDIISFVVFCIEMNTGEELSTRSTPSTNITIIGLHPYYSYACNISAVTVDDGPISDSVQVTTLEDSPSAPPYNVLIEEIGRRTVNLSWTEPEIEFQNGIIRNYLIHVTPRAAWLEPSKHITPSPQLSFTVHNLHSFSTYSINIAAVTVLPGPNSTSIDVNTKEDAPSAAPEQTTVSPLSAETLLVSWLPPPNEMQNGIIRSYTIRVLSIITGNVTVWTSSSLNITIPSLHPYYDYEVSVAATTVEQGPYCPEIEVTMPESEPAGPPIVTVKEVTADDIHICWTPPSASDQNGVIIGYTVQYFSNRTDTIISVQVNLTEHILPALPFTKYELRVAALNSAGTGPFSDYFAVHTLPDAPSRAPDFLEVVNITSSSMHLQWEEPPQEYHNGIIRSYTVICYELESDSNGTLQEFTALTTELSIMGLHPFFRYSCSVSAVTVSQGPFSDFIEVMTLEDAPSGRPYDLTDIEITPRTLSISWSPPDPSQWNGIIRYYIIYVLPVTFSMATSIYTYQTASNITIFTLTDLHPYTLHHIKVAAVTIASGPNSTVQLLQTAEDAPAAPPQDVSANPISSREVSVTWRAPPDNLQNGDIRLYNVTVLEEATGSLSWYNTTDSSTHWTITSLLPYHAYHIRVAAVTTGLGPFSEEVVSRTPEEAPSSPPDNLTVVEIGSSFVLLGWKSPPNSFHNGIIRHYIISLMDGNSTDTIRNITSPTSQSLINIGSLQPDTKYSCSVAAVTVSVGPFSKVIYFTTEANVPGTVLSLEARPISPQSINISWDPPLDEDMINEYLVNVTQFGGLYNFMFATTVTSQSVVVGLLHPHYVYQCSVIFRTSAGLGPFAQVFVQLPPDVPSGHPQNITAVPSDPYILHVYWSPPALEDQNGEITHYGINISAVKSLEILQYNTSGSQTSIVLHNFQPYLVYKFSLTAFTIVGNGPYSPVQEIQMPSAAPSSTPLNLSLDEIGSTFALLHWSPPPVDTLNGVIQHYRIHLFLSAESHSNFTTSGSETHILLNSLQPDTDYACTVAAVTVSPGPHSNPVHFTTNSSEPETVQYLTGTVLSSQAVNISWLPPLNIETFEQVVEYYVTMTPLDSGYRDVPLQNTTESTSIVFSSLHPGTFYYCAVAARTRLGLQQSLSILIELPPDVPSGHPQSIFAVASDSRTLHLTWSAPLLEERNGEIFQYGINLTEVESGEVMHFITEDSTSSFTIPNLHPQYFYSYTLTAFTSVGNGPYSPAATIQMPQDAPTGAPLNITVTNMSPGTVRLQWLPPPVNQRNGDISGYVVRVFDITNLVKIRDIEISDANFYSINGLKTSYPYNFSIAARTVVGWGPFSNPLFLVTLHGVSAAPTGIRAERVSPTNIRVSWPVLTSSLPILSYTIKYYALEEVQANRDMEKFINTTKNLTITELHPTFTYSLALAANTIAGRGNFSDEITVGLSENSLFQIFFSGAIDCQEWVLYHIGAKLNSAKTELALEINMFCECYFSADYLILNEPHCISAHRDWLILWGRIVGTNYTNSIAILDQLQEWSDMKSKIVVEGVHLTTHNFCPVSLGEGEPPYCETQIESAEGVKEPVSHVTSVIVGVIMTMLFVIFVVLVCLVTVSFYQKKKKARDRQLRFHADHPLQVVGNTNVLSGPVASKPSREDNDSIVYEKTDSLYETILDTESPYSELPSHPPPLPDSDVPTKSPLASAADPPEPVPMIYDTDNSELSPKDRSQRCPSPVDYTVMKPDSAPTVPDSEMEYATAKDGRNPSKLESAEDYTPMFEENVSVEVGDEKPPSYQKLMHAASEGDYQVPRPQVLSGTEGGSKDMKEKNEPYYTNYEDARAL